MTNEKSKKFPHAFTLIEILVAITIMSILFVVGYAGFRDFARRQELERAVRQVKGDLRYAQEQALSGKKISGGFYSPCNILDGYYFSPENETLTNSKYYKIQAVCDGRTHINTDTNKGFSIPLSNPQGNIVMGLNSKILFKALAQGIEFISPYGSFSEVTITLRQSYPPNLSRTITVTAGGEIR